MESFFNILFPPKCHFCNSYEGASLCHVCLQNCNEIFSTKCIICDKPSLFSTTHEKCYNPGIPVATLSLYEYKGIVRDVIRQSKYKPNKFVLLRELTKYGILNLKEAGFTISSSTLVVPIPISKKRKKERGFNQAKIIAKIISNEYKTKIESKTLVRTKNSKPQYSNNRRDRFENIRNVFNIRNSNKIDGKTVLLVDDIITSGATLLEASKTLFHGNCKDVWCVTLAKKELY